jgi:hypothetical protein
MKKPKKTFSTSSLNILCDIMYCTAKLSRHIRTPSEFLSEYSHTCCLASARVCAKSTHRFIGTAFFVCLELEYGVLK